jgi:glycosyltransferase involved in cell wall biosynthesis
MKVLLLVQKDQKAILDRLYEGIAAACDCETRWLTDAQQDDLKAYFENHVQVCMYDRIICFLRFKKEIKQAAFISTIPNLVILEHDAFQNYIDCKYRGVFSSHYRKIPWARVIVSGYQVAQKLKQEGFDAVFVPKGYDQTLCKNINVNRDIELGFVGGLKNKLYSRRAQFLRELAKAEPMVIESTAPGEPYVRMLNRIRFFVSADIGFGEYMIKNFEAMACGCVLFASNQGDAENRALGFVDMENVVLYKDLNELRQKLHLLRCNSELAATIALNGQRHAEACFKFSKIGESIVGVLTDPLRNPKDFAVINANSRVFNRIKQLLGGV